MRVFVDGGTQGSRAKTGNISPTVGGESIWIGYADQPENQAWSGQFEGDLDEVRISRVARSAPWIATQFNNESSPGAFYAVGAEAAGPWSPGTLAVNYRSIGTNGAVLYSTGTASVALGATTVTLAGASLPGNVGAGDVLTFTGAPAETLYVLSRDSATQLTLQGPATSAHTGQTYTITRAYTTLAAWETGRQGDLVGENRREIGMAYNDGPFTAGVTIDGSTTDPARTMKLTAAPGQRHLGRAGTGVVLDNGLSPSPAIQILDDFVTVEWLEIKGGSGPGAHGIELAAGINPANLVTVANNVIHDTGGDGVRLGDPDGIVDIREQHHLPGELRHPFPGGHDGRRPGERLQQHDLRLRRRHRPLRHQVGRAPDEPEDRPAQQHRPQQRERRLRGVALLRSRVLLQSGLHADRAMAGSSARPSTWPTAASPATSP